jgi:hypothetical protein
VFFGIHHFHYPFCPGVMGSFSIFVFLKPPLYVGGNTGIERTVFALNKIDKIHISKDSTDVAATGRNSRKQQRVKPLGFL